LRREWAIEPLEARHRRGEFDCGEPSLNDYIRLRAGQHTRKDISRTYVAVRPGDDVVWGYYTISSGSVIYKEAPEKLRRKLPNYPIPTAHIRRIAVHKSLQGQGLGELLLVNALKLSARLAGEIGICAVTVDANPAAVGFYKKYGLLEFEDDPRHLYLPTKLIRSL